MEKNSTNKFQQYLQQPYPFYYEDIRQVTFTLLLLALVSFLFSYLFEPFDINVAEHKIDSLWIMVLHAFMPVPIALVYFIILHKTVKNTLQWNIGKEFLHLSIVLLLIGIASFLLRDVIYTNPDNWSFRYFWEEIRNTFLIGILLLSIVLPLNRERLLHKHLQSIKQLPKQLQKPKTSTSIRIETPIATEEFEISLQGFRFAKVEGNYLEIICHDEPKNLTLLKRMTLKEFQEQLRDFPQVLKVHRSYLINLQAIDAISGNAQGYTLRLQDCPEAKIPVSRSHLNHFNQAYTNNKA